MAKPSYLKAEQLADSLIGIALVLENKAAAINKGKQLTYEDAGAFESFAASLRSAAKELKQIDAKLGKTAQMISTLNEYLGKD